MYSVTARRPCGVEAIAAAYGPAARTIASVRSKNPSIGATSESPGSHPPPGASATTGPPPAARGERAPRARPPARRQLQRHVAAERVADQVRCLEARLVHRLLDRV